MRVVVFGATGMVGQGVLRECLLASDVTEVLVVGRSPVPQRHPKLTEILVPDLADLTPIREQLSNLDACYFCLGVSSVGMSPEDYRRITYDLTVNAGRLLAEVNPGMTFIYVTGEGTDSTEQGRSRWARVKGATENALLAMPLNAYMFRPGFIRPLHGIKPRSRVYRTLLPILSPLFPLVQRLMPKIVTSTESIGLAMLEVTRSGAPKRVLASRDINALLGK